MIGLTRIFCILAVTLSLSGCIIGDGIAHVVKLAQENQQTSSAAPAGGAAAAPVAVHDEAPPPPPAAAPVRNSVSVETLAPPK
ncbi:MAG TPA: hypothetical protein VN809_00920 [Telmatospirillum sp.]|nr:hypothetical protein [Telmatospirillum sp.]